MTISKELAEEVCAELGCSRDLFCFGGKGTAKGLCIEAVTLYNELRREKLRAKVVENAMG
jgi:hypothetical protein